MRDRARRFCAAADAMVSNGSPGSIRSRSNARIAASSAARPNGGWAAGSGGVHRDAL